MHCGWAIEGAIGSKRKVEASYLSPHVNLSSRLEAATKQYGVRMLVSGIFYKKLSSYCRAKMRRVDRVVVKGSHVPMDLYCYDEETPKLASPPGGDGWEEVYEGERGFVRALCKVSSRSPKAFFETAIALYIEGKWLPAASMLSAWTRCCPDDAPAGVVLGVMKDRLKEAGLPLTSDCAPEEWASLPPPDTPPLHP